ncbi:A1S_2505 family phage non-structural protein, partial [Stenotrophomonas maltophilia]
AVEGVGRGWAGQSFAIPTLNEHIQQMPLSQIEHYVEDFKVYAKNHPKMKYFVTALGCGIAGYKVSEIAPLFKGIHHNVIFPE